MRSLLENRTFSLQSYRGWVNAISFSLSKLYSSSRKHKKNPFRTIIHTKFLTLCYEYLFIQFHSTIPTTTLNSHY